MRLWLCAMYKCAKCSIVAGSLGLRLACQLTGNLPAVYCCLAAFYAGLPAAAGTAWLLCMPQKISAGHTRGLGNVKVQHAKVPN